MKTKLFAAIAVVLSAVSPAFAHITLEVGQTPLGSPYKAVFRVPHGCDGAATTALRIQIPEGVIAVKPMPKPGWTLELKSGKYAKTYKNWGSDVSSGVTEVDFTGGNLPDAYYDEFVVTGTIADSFKAGDVIRFPVVQECGAAAERWIQVPAAGQKDDDLKRPAPALTVTAATGSDD